MGRHRSAGPAPSIPTDVTGRPRPQRSPRRLARLGQQLLALPWVTFVLLALVAGAAHDALRPDSFEARSTITALTRPAAAQAAVALTRAGLADDVEERIELEPRWRGEVRVTVERPAPEAVVVLAEAPDPRLAALAADTAVALVVEDDAELGLTEAAVVPTRPAGGSSRVPWVLGGGAALLLALTLERRREVREGTDEDGPVPAPAPPAPALATVDVAALPSARTAPVTSPTSPRPDPADRAVAAGGAR